MHGGCTCGRSAAPRSTSPAHATGDAGVGAGGHQRWRRSGRARRQLRPTPPATAASCTGHGRDRNAGALHRPRLRDRQLCRRTENDGQRDGVRPGRDGPALQRHGLRPERAPRSRWRRAHRASVATPRRQGQPVASALTDARGEFTMQDVPVGPNIPVVIQTGKWRRTDHAAGGPGLPGQRVPGCDDVPPAAQSERRTPAQDRDDPRQGGQPRVSAASDRRLRFGVHQPRRNRPGEHLLRNRRSAELRLGGAVSARLDAVRQRGKRAPLRHGHHVVPRREHDVARAADRHQAGRQGLRRHGRPRVRLALLFQLLAGRDGHRTAAVPAVTVSARRDLGRGRRRRRLQHRHQLPKGDGVRGLAGRGRRVQTRGQSRYPASSRRRCR